MKGALLSFIGCLISLTVWLLLRSTNVWYVCRALAFFAVHLSVEKRERESAGTSSPGERVIDQQQPTTAVCSAAVWWSKYIHKHPRRRNANFNSGHAHYSTFPWLTYVVAFSFLHEPSNNTMTRNFLKMNDLPEKRWPFSYILEVLEIRGNSSKSPHTRPPSSSVVRAGRYSPLPATAAQHAIIFRRLSVWKKKERKNYTTKNNNTIKNSQRSAAAQERQKIRNKSIILVRYYYAWKWGRLFLSGWQKKNNWQMHTHTHTQGGKWSSPGALFMSNTGGG